jgi:DUF2934 family protein
MLSQDKQAVDERVRKLAHFMWECEGRPEGKALEHWHKAEAEIKSELPRSWADMVHEQQSRFHAHITSAKERLDEMDAALASLEREARRLQPASRAKTDRLIVDLRKRRDEFQHAILAQIEAGEANWLRDMSKLKMQLDGFIAGVNDQIGAFEQQVGAQQAVFRDLAVAQGKAWHDAAKQIHGAAVGFAAERRAEIEHIAQEMEADASKTEAQLKQLMGAGKESWSALRDALHASRAAFDRGVQSAGDAFKRAAEQASQKPTSTDARRKGAGATPASSKG